MGCSAMRVRIEGELWEVDSVSTRHWPSGVGEIECGGATFLVCDSTETADEMAKDRWRDMDAKELVAMIGEEEIVQLWTNGTTMEEWLNDLDTDQELAGYDGCSNRIDRVGRVCEELGFTPTIAYRTN